MNQKIKILPKDQAIKIAAGEVVERPANIIKELIENSIDASSNQITIFLENAGKSLIKIIDNGCGMSKADAQLCFAHHATSKISSVNDLLTLQSFGFRGEALSSIAAVSRVTLITRTSDDQAATKVIAAEGNIEECTIASHPVGTTLIVQNLFDCIPARKKFLKSNETELNAIINVFQAFALTYPSFLFKLYNDNNLIFNCPPAEEIMTRAGQLFTGNLQNHLIPIATKTEQNITISGAISTMHYYRFNRGQIFTFANNRYVKNNEISKAILKAYDGVLPLQKFPAAFIFIQTNPEDIDINIHPKKEEVKFLHQGKVSSLVQETIKESLKNHTTSQLQNQPLHLPKTENFNTDSRFSIRQNSYPMINRAPFAQPTLDSTKKIDQLVSPKAFQPATEQEQLQTTEECTVPAKQTVLAQVPPTIIGQLHQTYILIEKENETGLKSLIMIDQHAAHERILYEKYKAHHAAPLTVALLFPFACSADEIMIKKIMQLQNIFQKHGIIIDQFSEKEFLIQATPVQTSPQQALQIIQTVYAWTQAQTELNFQLIADALHEQIFAARACKTAVKAGDILTTESMTNIIKELAETEQNYCCPHGRPTMWAIHKTEIEKHFKRDYAGAKKIVL